MRSTYREGTRKSMRLRPPPPSDSSAAVQDPPWPRKTMPATAQIDKAKEELEDSIEQVVQRDQQTTGVLDSITNNASIYAYMDMDIIESSSSPMKMKMKELLIVEETKQQPQEPDSYCAICMDTKTSSEMFRNTNVCGHTFCSECIREHVAARIKENLATVMCPDPRCKGEIGPQACQSIVPKQVLDRWEMVLCESLIMGSQKFYCPFKDCSAMLVDDGGVTVTSSECPHCHRLFCAQCKVAWHAGLDCGEYKSLKTGERDPHDLSLMKLAKDKKWMRCPRCAYYVEKTVGCLHISCRCGCQFCYGCGKENPGTHAAHACVHRL